MEIKSSFIKQKIEKGVGTANTLQKMFGPIH